MTISPFSEIFPPDIRHFCPRKALSVFDRLSYLYEIIEYRKTQVERAQLTKPDVAGWHYGTIELPENKNPQFGADQRLAQNTWSVFVLSAEFESYLSEIIRFFNLSFVLINEEFFKAIIDKKYFTEDELRKPDTVARYIKFENKVDNETKRKVLSLNKYNTLLKHEWLEWGLYISWIRNYFTHSVPLSGSFGDIASLAGSEEGYNLIRLPTKESLIPFGKKLNQDDYKDALQEDWENGKFYHSLELIKDYHPKFQAMALDLFDEKERSDAFWWSG